MGAVTSPPLLGFVIHGGRAGGRAAFFVGFGRTVRYILFRGNRKGKSGDTETVQTDRLGLRLNGFLGLSLNDGTILFLVILLDMTVSVG